MLYMNETRLTTKPEILDIGVGTGDFAKTER